MPTNPDIIVYVIGALLTIIISLVVYAFTALSKSVDEKFQDIHNQLKRVDDDLDSNAEDTHDLETRFLENQIAAAATFVTKDDFRECWHNKKAGT